MENFYETDFSAVSFRSACCCFHFRVCAKSEYIQPAVTVGKDITTQYFFQNLPTADRLPNAIKLKYRKQTHTNFSSDHKPFDSHNDYSTAT